MSHFNACVLVKKDGSTAGALAKQAEKMLADFDINKEVAPHKYYLDKEEVRRMAGHYKIDPSDRAALAAKLEDWNGDKDDADDQGVYGITTRNPEGHADYWTILGEVKPEDRARLLLGEGEEKLCRAVILPGSQWIDGPYIYSLNDSTQAEYDAWREKLSKLLDEHKDAAAFLADCHI